MPETMAMLELEGIPVAGGSRVGRAVVFEDAPGTAISLVPAGPPEAEIERFGRALERAHAGLADLRASLGGDMSIGEIFRAHGMMLDAFREEIEAVIREGGSAEHAVARVMHAKAERFARAENAMLVQRGRDVVSHQFRIDTMVT
ncbi:MAG: phosphoenolpyruvate-utilizing N-terminal domain-containing protein, partial [Planctomycetota bacterium]